MSSSDTSTITSNSVTVTVGQEPGCGTDRDVCFEGWLLKRSRGRGVLKLKAWAERRFVLTTGKVLQYFDGDTCKGEVNIAGARAQLTTSSEVGESSDPSKHYFTVTNDAETLVLAADADWRATKWVETINSLASGAYSAPPGSGRFQAINPLAARKAGEPQVDKYPEVKAALLEWSSLPENERCADCDAPKPQWASVNNGVLICTSCSGVHRSLGVEFSFVQSLKLDDWTPANLALLQSEGPTVRANSAPDGLGLEYHVPTDYRKPVKNSTREQREAYIRAKYVLKLFRPTTTDNSSDGEVDRGMAVCPPQPPISLEPPAAAAAGGTSIGEIEFIGVIMVKVISGKDLVNADFFGLSDPYCVLTLAKQSLKTKRIDDNCNPVWNETLMMSFDGVSPLRVEVFDYDRFKAHDRLGDLTIDLAGLSLEDGVPVSIDQTLENIKKGSIQIEITLNLLS